MDTFKDASLADYATHRVIASWMNVLLKEAKGHCRRFFFGVTISTREYREIASQSGKAPDC
jgi:hypothetical protein